MLLQCCCVLKAYTRRKGECMAINSVDSGSSLINSNAKVHVAGKTDTESVAQQKTLETQKHTLQEIFAGEADTVDISDEARSLSQAAQELAEKEAAIEEEAENATVVVQAETQAADKSSTPKPTVTVASSEVYGKEDRKNTGDYYSSVLEDLRSHYSEDEAMRTFDDFMRSEGYELGPAEGLVKSGMLGIGLNTPRATMGSLYSMGSYDFAMKYGIGQGGIGDSRLTLHSVIGAAEVNGEYKIFAESTAQYYAYNSDATRDVVDGWAGQYAEQFAEQSGMDMDALRETLGWESPYTAIAAADKDLGSTVMDIVGDAFKQAGVEFSGQDQLSFTLTYDENGNASGVETSYFPREWDIDSDEDFDKFLNLQESLQKSLSQAIAHDPSLLDAFSAMSDSVEVPDADSLDGAFSDGERGVSYSIARHFTISGAQPDTIVMSDSLQVTQSGYTYHKKTDAFDPEADSVHLSVPQSFPGHPDSAVDEMGAHVKGAIKDAIDNGTQVGSDMDRDTYDANRKSTIPGLVNPDEIDHDAQMYDSRTGESASDANADKNASETDALKEEESEEAQPGSASSTSSAYEDKNSARRSAVEDLLTRAKTNNDMRTVSMLNNLMNSLNELYADF